MSKLEIPRKTGKWLRADVPHTGWRCTEVEERPGLCEMCEVTPIVYAHRMVHDRYPLWLDCGCVCAGFMTDDPATEQLRETLYKWRRITLLNRTPVEKLRRKSWSRGTYAHAGNIFVWDGSFRGAYRDFRVEVGSADGWRFHVYYRRSNLVISEQFTSDLDAVLAGIAWVEMLMANQQWLASDSEARAEEQAAWEAERLASDIRYAAKRGHEMGREDIVVLAETGRIREAHHQIFLARHCGGAGGQTRD